MRCVDILILPCLYNQKNKKERKKGKKKKKQTNKQTKKKTASYDTYWALSPQRMHSKPNYNPDIRAATTFKHPGNIALSLTDVCRKVSSETKDSLT